MSIQNSTDDYPASRAVARTLFADAKRLEWQNGHCKSTRIKIKHSKEHSTIEIVRDSPVLIPYSSDIDPALAGAVITCSESVAKFTLHLTCYADYMTSHVQLVGGSSARYEYCDPDFMDQVTKAICQFFVDYNERATPRHLNPQSR